MKNFLKILISSCLAFLLLHCSEKNMENDKIDEYRGINQMYNTNSSTEDITNKYEIGKNDSDPNVRLMHEMSYYFYLNGYSSSVVKNKYDSIISLPHFENYEPIVKFYAYYNLSNLYIRTFNSKKAFESNVKADSYIHNEYRNYLEEKVAVQNQIQNLALKIFDDKEQFIRQFKERLNGPEGKILVKATRLNYNIAFIYSELEKHRESLKYAKKVTETYPVNTNDELYMNAMGLQSEAYAKLDHFDSVLIVEKMMKKLHRSGLIDDREYNLFYIFTLDDHFKIDEETEILHKYDSLSNNFDTRCKSSYPLVELNKTISIYFQEKHDLEKERQTLVKELNAIDRCTYLDKFFLSEKYRIYSRLIDIDVESGRSDNLALWHSELRKLDDIKDENTNFYIKITKYLSEKDMDYAQRELDYQKEQVSNTKKVNILYALLVIIFIISIFYIGYLYRKNIKYQNKLKDGSNLLRNQNTTISAQNRKMEKLVNALTESNENLENFARVAAHDIKSPISSIHNAISYITEKYKNKISGDDQEIFSYLNQSTLNLNNMINVLLEYSSQNKNVQTNEKVEVVEVINNIEKNLSTLISASGAELNYPDVFPDIRANKIFTEQIFMNLINNALKFSKPNVKPIIDIDFEIPDNKNIVFSISDNGIGIPMKYQENIFKVFQKYHQTDDQIGSGIGLAICKKIVEDLRGQIWVESTPDVGSTFYVKLPLFQKRNIAKKQNHED